MVTWSIGTFAMKLVCRHFCIYFSARTWYCCVVGTVGPEKYWRKCQHLPVTPGKSNAAAMDVHAFDWRMVSLWSQCVTSYSWGVLRTWFTRASVEEAIISRLVVFLCFGMACGWKEMKKLVTYSPVQTLYNLSMKMQLKIGNIGGYKLLHIAHVWKLSMDVHIKEMFGNTDYRYLWRK